MTGAGESGRGEAARAAARATARTLLSIGAVHCRPQAPFTLTSGRASPVYIDCRKVISYPHERARLMDLAVETIAREAGADALDSIAGGETAGIPFAAWIAERMDLPMLYVRKKPKGFGRMAQIEGELAEGARVLLVEDLATDAGSKVNFVEALRAAGARVDHVFVLFHYGIFARAADTLDRLGVRLHALATWWDVLAAAEETRAFDPSALESIRAFLDDPENWAPAPAGA